MLKVSSTNSRRRRDSGHLLLAILLLMALMVIAATYEAPRIVQQMKRDREEEMIHRGTEYARAIKKFYKKFGRYPTGLEQLDKTNNIRFIRKRYKDPLTKDGKWTLLRYGDIATLLNANAPGTPAAALGSQGQGTTGTPAGQPSSSGFGPSTFGSSSPTTSGGFGTSNFGSSSNQPPTAPQGSTFAQQQALSGAGQSTFGGSGQTPTSGFGAATSPSFGGSSSTNPGSTFGSGSSPGLIGGNPSTSTATSSAQGSTAGGQVFGGGSIVGVASTSKDPTIRVYNKKKTYNEWQFIYNPVMDQANVLLKGPYSPTTLGGGNVGTPAGQLNQQQQQQQQSPFGQPSSGFGSQQPGGQQFPPDQNH